MPEEDDTEEAGVLSRVQGALQGSEAKTALTVVVTLIAVAAAALILGTYVLGLGQQVSAPADGDYRPPDDVSEGNEYEIQTGDVTVDSENATADVGGLKTEVGEYGAEVEGESREESERRVVHSVTVLVPSGRFEAFVEYLKRSYDVTHAEVSYRTVEVSETRNEVRVLTRSMRRYERLLSMYDVGNLSRNEVDSDTVSTISELTDERLALARQLNDLSYDIAETEERAERSRLTVTFREEREPPVVPEDLTGEVRYGVRNGLDSVSDNVAKVIALPFTAVSVVLTVFRYVVYAAAAATPLAVVYAGARRFGVRRARRLLAGGDERSGGERGNAEEKGREGEATGEGTETEERNR